MADKKLITPVIKVDISQIAPEPHFEAKSGYYHLVSLNKDGSEKVGSDFYVNARTFDRSYKDLTEGDNATFKVKKNPNIQ
jgi:hypothetical protein